MRSNSRVIIGMMLLFSFIPQFVAAQIPPTPVPTPPGPFGTVPVTSNVAGQGIVEIGELYLAGFSPTNEPEVISAGFIFDDDFSFLDDWYNFRWINVMTGFTITGPEGVCCGAPGLPDCGAQNYHPKLGNLPAIDPAPGDGTEATGVPGQGTPPLRSFTDASPYYFTDLEHAACVSEGVIYCLPGLGTAFKDFESIKMQHLKDGTIAECDGTFEFVTFLVAENVSDAALGEKTFCLLAGFEWMHVSSSTPGPITSSDILTGTIDEAQLGALAAGLVQDAITNSGSPLSPTPQDFLEWSAVADCTLRGCTPPNDSCPDGDSLFEGLTPFDTSFATTDDIPLLAGVCLLDPPGDNQIYNDIWYRYTATANGTVTVSTCGLVGFDTRLAVYQGIDCPAPGSLALVACDDNGSGCGAGNSELVFEAVDGQEYLIRLGSAAPDVAGTGEIMVSAPVAKFRRGDTNVDGNCDISDVVNLLNYLFVDGTPARCKCMDACDVNDDGVVDLTDGVAKIQFLFVSGSAIPDPGPVNCGPDPTEDAIGCANYDACP